MLNPSKTVSLFQSLAFMDQLKIQLVIVCILSMTEIYISLLAIYKKQNVTWSSKKFIIVC